MASLFTAIVVSTADGVRAQSDLPDACSFFEGDVEFVSQTLYMQQERVRHDLSVPTVYFEDPWDKVDGEEHRAQLFRVMIDDFIPVSRIQTAALMKAGNTAFFNFVLHDLVPLEQLLDNQLRFSAPGETRNNPKFETSPGQYFGLESTEFGIEFLKPATDVETFRDVYVARDESGRIATILSCSRQKDYLNPSCSHDFRSHGIDVRANFRLRYLPKWKEIQTDVTDSVGCMVEN